MPALIPGRMADLEAAANAGALFPVKYSGAAGALAAGTTTFTFAAAEAGRMRHFTAYVVQSANTVTVNVKKNGTTVMTGAQTLTTATNQIIEGLGTDTSGADEDFNTNVAASRALLTYAKGDLIQVEFVVTTTALTNCSFALTCDERQPTTKSDWS